MALLRSGAEKEGPAKGPGEGTRRVQGKEVSQGAESDQLWHMLLRCHIRGGLRMQG